MTYIALSSHRLGYRLVSQLVYRWQRNSRSSESSIARSFSLARPCLGLFPFIVPTFSPFKFHLFYYYSCVCFFLLLHLYCSHTRGYTHTHLHTPTHLDTQTLTQTHTGTGSPFPSVHAKWSLIFRSFGRLCID